ncbi:MAG: hypothetical protein ACPL3A_10215 [Thermoanaerobacteraceae bacterium]
MIFKTIVLFIIKLIPDFNDVFCIGIVVISFITYFWTHRKPKRYVKLIDSYIENVTFRDVPKLSCLGAGCERVLLRV